MKKPLEILMNGLFRNEMKLLFGENYKIEIGHFIKDSKNHHFIVHANLLIDDPMIISENYTGIDSSVDEDISYYVNKCIRFLGTEKKALVISTIDII